MKILVHTCCGPCSIYPLQALKEEGHDVTAFWYNPNIHPYREYQKRRETLREYCSAEGIKLIDRDEYPLDKWLKTMVSVDRSEHCRLCFRLRLTEAAGEALRLGLPAFTTSLLISPYQKHEAIREEGEKIASEGGLSFWYRDYRPWYREGADMSRQAGMYRQPYCGCIYSEAERYRKKDRSGGGSQ